MKIESGLLDHAVVQRNKKGVCDAPFSGVADHEGEIEVTARRGTRVLARAKTVARHGQFSGRLTGVPAGGPFDVEFKHTSAREKVVVKDLLVGDVWIAGGQSNMEGVGILRHAVKPISDVRAMYQDDHWGIAQDPLHDRAVAVDPVFNNGNITAPALNRTVGSGPAVAFAQRMREITGVPQGVIACALGATAMRQWDPALLAQGGRSLYGSMMRRFVRCGGQAAGLIWYQGESDALEKAQDLFVKRMTDFVALVRRDTRDLKLPVVMVQIARVVGWGSGPEWNAIQDLQRVLGETIPGVATVPAIDLQLDDTIHIGGEGQNRLGRRMAYAMDVLRRGKAAGKPPIRLKSAHVERSHPHFDLIDVVLTFENVVGSLSSGGARPSGFAIGEAEPAQAVIDTRLEGNRVRLVTTFPFEQIGARKVFYAHGTDAYVNITDEADRAIPVFAALKMAEMRRAK